MLLETCHELRHELHHELRHELHHAFLASKLTSHTMNQDEPLLSPVAPASVLSLPVLRLQLPGGPLSLPITRHPVISES